MPTEYNPTRELLTPNEVTVILKISKTGVYRLIAQRKIRFYKERGSIRFDRNDVEAYLQKIRIEVVG